MLRLCFVQVPSERIIALRLLLPPGGRSYSDAIEDCDLQDVDCHPHYSCDLHLRSLFLVPFDGHLCDLHLLLGGDDEELGVEAPPLDVLVREELSGGLA
jgi:hypothetical protein